MKGSNNRNIWVTSPNGEDEIEVNVQYDWYYQPGRMYLSNGDPGYPDESEVEITDWDVVDEEKPEWLTDELVQEAFDKAEIELFDDEEDDDYDEDYERERGEDF
jgi:hypothetical protein